MTKRINSCLLMIGFLFISLPGMFAQIAFTNRTAELLTTTDYHSGVAIAVTDMNGDFLDDIIHLEDGRILHIEYQVPGGVFTNYEFGTVSNNSEWTICVADVDNNGYGDVITGGFYNDVKLFMSDNDGNSLTQSTLPGATIFCQASNFADIDNDGAVDIFVCHDDGPSRIWQNDGAGNFSMGDNMINLSIFPGIEDNSGNYGSVWTDFDSDGDLDLYIAKCRQGVNDPTDPRRINQLWINDGNNNYTEAAAAFNLNDGGQSWTTEFADIDNDGDFDALVTNHDVISKLYENINNTTFVDITAASGLNIGVLPIQGIMKDFDNDGFLDIIIAGSDHEVWRNNGNKTFTEIANPFDSNDMESYAIGDLNHDGFLDVYGGYANIYTTPSNI
ncbi:MAG: VCBS repeat-containing protein, partial [Bacteroidota bacterium]